MAITLEADKAMQHQPLHEVLVAEDGRTLWVNGPDGSLIGRFSKVFGMDVHRTATEQMAGGRECLFCTHGKPDAEEWTKFRELIKFRTHKPRPSGRGPG